MQQNAEHNINARKGSADITTTAASITHIIAGITSDLLISPEQCRSLAIGESMHLADQFLAVEYDTKNPIV